MTDDLARWQQFVGRLDELGARDHPAAVPHHRRRPHRGAPSSRAADRLLVGLVDRPPGPASTGVPAAERPRPAVGRAERRQRLPPRPRRPLAPLPHRRPDALVRRLHPRHPPQLHAHGGVDGTIAELSAHDLGLGSRRRLRDPPRRRRRRTEPRAIPRRRPVGVDTRVLLRLAAAGAGHLHHRVPRRRRPVRPVLRRRPRLRARRGGHPPAPVTHVLEPVHARRVRAADGTTSSAAVTTSSAASRRRSTRSASSTSRPTRRSSSSATSRRAATGASTSTTSRGGRRWSTRRVSPVAITRRPASPTTAASASWSRTRTRAYRTGSTPRAAGRRSSRSGGSGRRVIRRRRRPRS